MDVITISESEEEEMEDVVATKSRKRRGVIRITSDDEDEPETKQPPPAQTSNPDLRALAPEHIEGEATSTPDPRSQAPERAEGEAPKKKKKRKPVSEEVKSRAEQTIEEVARGGGQIQESREREPVSEEVKVRTEQTIEDVARGGGQIQEPPATSTKKTTTKRKTRPASPTQSETEPAKISRPTEPAAPKTKSKPKAKSKPKKSDTTVTDIEHSEGEEDEDDDDDGTGELYAEENELAEMIGKVSDKAIIKEDQPGQLLLRAKANTQIKNAGERLLTYSMDIITDEAEVKGIYARDFHMYYFYHVYKGVERIATPTQVASYLTRDFDEERCNARFEVADKKVYIVSTKPIRKGSNIVVYSGPTIIHRWNDGQWEVEMRYVDKNTYSLDAVAGEMDIFYRPEAIAAGCTDNLCGTAYNRDRRDVTSDCVCFNYHFVCDTSLCKCDPLVCRNRPFEYNNMRKTYLEQSPVHGVGLFAEEDIAVNDWIIEYVGEVITYSELEERSMYYSLEGSNYVAEDRDGSIVIDATRIGNNARYANHSCSPNAAAVKVIDRSGIPRLCLLAISPIAKGQEIVWDYAEVVNNPDELLACHCKANGCTGKLNRLLTAQETKEKKR